MIILPSTCLLYIFFSWQGLPCQYKAIAKYGLISQGKVLKVQSISEFHRTIRADRHQKETLNYHLNPLVSDELDELVIQANRIVSCGFYKIAGSNVFGIINNINPFKSTNTLPLITSSQDY